MYCGNCKHFSKNGHCMDISNYGKTVAYFAPMCKHGNIPLPPGFAEPSDSGPHTKTCKYCGRTLPVEQFARNASGYTRVCKECKVQIMRRASHSRTRSKSK